MTDKKKFKARVRERMARTGESYTTAKRNVESDSNEGGFEARRREFRKQALEEWRNLTEKLAGERPIVSWTGVAEITRVLSRIGIEARRNHTLFPSPDGGGLDLVGAAASHETDCIELRFENQEVVVRPISLHLHMPERDPLREWAYFMLETGGLAPSGVYKMHSDRQEEYVLEVSPGKYIDSKFEEEGYYGSDENGEPLPLPRSARVISRHFRGTFLIMAKGSTYVTIDRYEGDHASMSASEFRSTIERLIDTLHRNGGYGKDLLLSGR